MTRRIQWIHRKYLLIGIASVFFIVLCAVSAYVIGGTRHDQRGGSVASDPKSMGDTKKQNPPTSPSTGDYKSDHSYPWHTGIVATTFWVGELFNGTVADGSQVCSTYDREWAYHWSGGLNHGRVPVNAQGCAGSTLGGCDGVVAQDGICNTERRSAATNYFPSSAQPKENPFYIDIPYDDLNDSIAFKERCAVIPWANDTGYAGRCIDHNFSYMKNRFVRIVGPNGHTCYGQIEDAGPSHDDLYHDKNYIFGPNDTRPYQQQFNNAGMDVSPALNGCLGFSDLNGESDKVNWQFVDEKDVPLGPWKNVVTSSGVSK